MEGLGVLSLRAGGNPAVRRRRIVAEADLILGAPAMLRLLESVEGRKVPLDSDMPTALRDPQGFRDAWRRYTPHAILLGVVSPMAYVLVLYAVRIAPLSHVAPAREVSMLFAALLGGRLLGEGDRGQRVLGAIMMAAGVVLLAV